MTQLERRVDDLARLAASGYSRRTLLKAGLGVAAAALGFGAARAVGQPLNCPAICSSECGSTATPCFRDCMQRCAPGAGPTDQVTPCGHICGGDGDCTAACAQGLAACLSSCEEDVADCAQTCLERVEACAPCAEADDPTTCFAECLTSECMPRDEPCGSSDDCCADDVCRQGVCAAPECSGDDDCDAGESCDEGVCVPSCAGETDPCETDADCCEGLSCLRGVCGH